MRLILKPLRNPGVELQAVTKGPFSPGTEKYFELRSLGFPDRPLADDMPASARIAALDQVLKHRLGMMTDVVRRIENLGWRTDIVDGDVVIQTDLSGNEAWALLQEQGISDHIRGLLETVGVAEAQPKLSDYELTIEDWRRKSLLALAAIGTLAASATFGRWRWHRRISRGHGT